MPKRKVDGKVKHYPYTAAGEKAAKAAGGRRGKKGRCKKAR